MSVVEREYIGFSELVHHAVNDRDPLGVSPAHDRLATGAGGHIQCATASQDRSCAVVGYVKIQRPIAINVRQRHRSAAQSGN